MSEKECNCSLRIKLVGDGCAVCNPEYAAQFSDEDDEAAPIPYELTPAGREQVGK
jgi:hypothetical protein